MQMDMAPEQRELMMLTPKMRLNMYVLQLNIIDLGVFLRAELEENPLLEEESVNDREENKFNEEISMLNNGFTDYQQADEEREEKRQYIESLITKKESLYEHLIWQLDVLGKDEEEKRIGRFIISHLDNNGFLTITLKEIRKKLNTDFRKFKQCLSLIRSFDPGGVGARNIKEALIIQLLVSGKKDRNLYRIIYRHLEDLEKGNFEEISKRLSISLEEINKDKRRISYLTPKPGINFGRENVLYITPDIILNKSNGSYKVEINERNLPRLKVNHMYNFILKDNKTPEDTREFVRKKLLNAQWLVDAVKQRKKTIARICEYLVEKQKDFLSTGDVAVKPLTLKQVGKVLLISEATVSRAVSNKYIQVSQRVFPLKDFFAGEIKTINGKAISNRRVKHKIQSLIENEDTKKTLSDEDITLILKKEGINISRRTVAKYRHKLGFLPFYLRKKTQMKK